MFHAACHCSDSAAGPGVLAAVVDGWEAKVGTVA